MIELKIYNPAKSAWELVCNQNLPSDLVQNVLDSYTLQHVETNGSVVTENKLNIAQPVIHLGSTTTDVATETFKSLITLTNAGAAIIATQATEGSTITEGRLAFNPEGAELHYAKDVAGVRTLGALAIYDDYIVQTFMRGSTSGSSLEIGDRLELTTGSPTTQRFEFKLNATGIKDEHAATLNYFNEGTFDKTTLTLKDKQIILNVFQRTTVDKEGTLFLNTNGVGMKHANGEALSEFTVSAVQSYAAVVSSGGVPEGEPDTSTLCLNTTSDANTAVLSLAFDYVSIGSIIGNPGTNELVLESPQGSIRFHVQADKNILMAKPPKLYNNPMFFAPMTNTFVNASGDLRLTMGSNSTTTTVTLAGNTVYFTPVIVGKRFKLNTISYKVTTAPSAATTLDMGIFDAWETTGRPKNRLHYTTSVAVPIGTGMRTITPSSQVILEPGRLYWLAVTAVASFTMTAYNLTEGTSVANTDPATSPNMCFRTAPSTAMVSSCAENQTYFSNAPLAYTANVTPV